MLFKIIVYSVVNRFAKLSIKHNIRKAVSKYCDKLKLQSYALPTFRVNARKGHDNKPFWGKTSISSLLK